MAYTKLTRAQVAKYIDHAVLRTELSAKEVEARCLEGVKYGCFSVCVNPSMIHIAREVTRNSDVKVCAVVAFPLGATTPECKAYEAQAALRAGADEIDMVANIGAIKSGDWDLVARDVSSVVKAAGPALVKVILETCYLTDEEKVRACKVCAAAGAHFVKTSTGRGTFGATLHDVVVLKRACEDMGVRVKASAGIRYWEDAVALIEAGADRLGTFEVATVLSSAPPNTP
ncbi:MAG: deoxyribose-phosphate aldolase [Clostridia bacterium]